MEEYSKSNKQLKL